MINLTNKLFFITGVANKKSIATFTAKKLIEYGAECIFSAQNETNLKNVNKLFPNSKAFLLDVRDKNQIDQISQHFDKKIDGFLHSLAFARFDPNFTKFHQTPRDYFLEAALVSSFSLVEISNAIKDQLNKNASIVTVSISNTKATSYGYLGPIKAMLETSVCYLAKSFSEFSKIRFNSVGAGPLKTSASAGIPDYIDNYLYSEELTLRKKNLETSEVANTITYLLTDLSSGINAQNIIIDAGMSSNYFDQKIVKKFTKES